MRWLSVLVVVLVGACAQPRLQRADGVSAVAPPALDVRTFVGFPVERTVFVSNSGRAALGVTVGVSSGLALLGADGFEVAVGQTVEVTVRVPATAAGAVEEAVGLTIDGVRTEVPLTGEIVAVPPCPAPNECQRVRFDPIAQACIEEPLEDGAACGGACLVAASCRAGACVGTAKSCDDGNLCTQDACAADGTCTHLDISEQCKVEGGPACEVAACEPQLGCVMKPAADGTVCGPNDCSTAYVCMAGGCQVVVPPEGSACSAATPCQTEGRCVADSCVSTPHPITPAWELLDTATIKRTLLGVTSPSGLFFAVERHLPDVTALGLPVGIYVVAYDRGGFERWRSALYTDYWSTTALYDAERGQLIVASKTWARALDGVTGAQKWFIDLDGEIPLGNATPTGAKQVYPLKMTLLPGARRVVAAYSEGSESHAVWVFGLDLLTGQQAFKLRRHGHLYGLMSTATDELFMGSAACWALASWNATFTAAGAPGWEIFQPGVPALSTGTLLYFHPYSGGGVPPNAAARFELATGVLTQEMTTDNKAVLANGSKVFLTSSLTQQTLTAWDSQQQKVRWRRSGVPMSQAFLTTGDGVLGLSRQQAVHVDDQGALEWSCALSGPLTTELTSCLLDGRLIGQTSRGLGAFGVGALKVSAKGWSVSERGNPERTSRPR